MKKLKIALWVISALVALYTLAGFFLTPYFAKDIATKQLQKRYGINLSVEKIYFNPYTFFIEITNLRISENKTPLVSFTNFQANMNPLKYFVDTLEISAASLSNLHLHVTLENEKNLNFVRIFAPEQTSQQQSNTENPPVFKLDSFRLNDAFVHFQDQSQEQPYTLELGPLNHTFTGFSTQALRQSKHTLAFDLGTYGQLNIDAQMSVNPLTVTAQIDHRAINLANSDYLLQKQKFAFAKGGLSYVMDFMFESNGQSIVKIPLLDANITDVALMIDGNQTLESKGGTFNLRDLNFVIDSSDVTVGKIDTFIEQSKIHDNFVAKRAHFIDTLHLNVDQFDINGSFNLAAQIRSEQTQELNVTASVDLAKNRFDMTAKAKKIDLSRYNDYVDDYVNIALQEGLLNFDTQGSIVLENNATTYDTKTNFTVNDLSIVNQKSDKLLQTKTIQADIDAKTNGVSVNDVTIDTMQLYFTRENNQTNFDNLVVTNNTRRSTEQTKEKPNFILKQASLVNGSIFIKDKASFVLENIEASLTNVQERTNAKATLKGELSTHETVSIESEFNPFAPTNFLRLNGQVQSFDLKQISPYAYGSIGREILSGRLSDSFYLNIDDAKLDSNHQITINNLNVSEHIPQSGATQLPINLAIALLQDMNNVINLNLDIKNDLNDPAFKARDIVLTVLTNVIVKTVSSPFSLLGAMVGLSGDALSEVSFEPASTKLSQQSIVTLDALAKVLNERPELSVRVCGAYDAVLDAVAVKKTALEALLQTQTLESVAKTYAVAIDADEEKTKAAIIAAMDTDTGTLEALAKNRAQNVLAYLLQANIAAQRLQVCSQTGTQSLDVTFELNAD